MRIKPITINTSLAGLVAACVIPVIGIGAVSSYLGYKEQRTRLSESAVASARALLFLVDAQFSGSEVSMRTLATSPSLKDGNLPAFDKRARGIAGSSFAKNVILFSRDGQELVNTLLPYGDPLPKTSNIKQLDRVLRLGRTDVSELYVGAVVKKYQINVTIPVFEEKTVTHLLTATMEPQHLYEVIRAQHFPDDVRVSIIDRDGVIAARSHAGDQFVGTSAGEELKQRVQNAREGFFDAVALDGIRVVVAFSVSPESRWVVAYGIPVDSLTADLRRSFLVLGLTAALLLCISLSIAWLISRRIKQAFYNLQGPAVALGRGELVVVPKLDIFEANEVGQALTKASGKLIDTRKALIDSEARMRNIVESASDAVVILDDEWRVLLFNSAASTMFQCSSVDAVGHAFDRFIPERFREKFSLSLQLDHAAQRSGSAKVMAIETMTVMRSDGTEFPVELSFPAMLIGAIGVQTVMLRDITERLKALELIEQSNLDLQQFAFVASHDLKTPLRSIVGFLQILVKNHKQELGEKAQGLINRTLTAAQRLELLIEDLLSYARLNSEVKPFEWVDCSEAVSDALHLLEAAVRSTDAVITVKQLPSVMGNRIQLVQLFLNLIGNALKYCKGQPVVVVDAELAGAYWHFSVSDNGIGIDPKHHEQIFEVFKRLHTQTEYAGTGIGLALCRRVVERHGGKIWITSQDGQGSTFNFTIPATSSDREAS